MSFCVTSPPPPPISTLSLHDALPISLAEEEVAGVDDLLDLAERLRVGLADLARDDAGEREIGKPYAERSEEHTSELQSPYDLVCRLLLEKKNISVDQFNCHWPKPCRI